MCIEILNSRFIFIFTNNLQKGAIYEHRTESKGAPYCENLTQEETADRSELSKGFISQLERDLTSPSIATLVDILQCLGTNLNEFFSDDEEEQVVFGDEDYFEKKDTDLKNTIEWIIPNAQRNMMEPIRLTLAPGGATYPDLPHEGEEFGYVLQGSVKIHVGNKVYK